MPYGQTPNGYRPGQAPYLNPSARNSGVTTANGTSSSPYFSANAAVPVQYTQPAQYNVPTQYNPGPNNVPVNYAPPGYSAPSNQNYGPQYNSPQFHVPQYPISNIGNVDPNGYGANYNNTQGQYGPRSSCPNGRCPRQNYGPANGATFQNQNTFRFGTDRYRDNGGFSTNVYNQNGITPDCLNGNCNHPEHQLQNSFGFNMNRSPNNLPLSTNANVNFN